MPIPPFRLGPQGLSGWRTPEAVPDLSGPGLVSLPGWPKCHFPVLCLHLNPGSPAHEGSGSSLAWWLSLKQTPSALASELHCKIQHCPRKWVTTTEALESSRNMWTLVSTPEALPLSEAPLTCFFFFFFFYHSFPPPLLSLLLGKKKFPGRIMPCLHP